MEYITIINQPLRNRGDESAHRSLLRSLRKDMPNYNIKVVFVNDIDEDIEQIKVKGANIEYINIKSILKGSGFTQKYFLKYNLLNLSLLRNSLRKYASLISKSKYIICAPGGICMGGFQSWKHIYGLLLAKKYQKEIVYYSRSFGPFPEKTRSNRVFKKYSLSLLKYFSFLSIRDKKTMKLSEELGIKYLPSIDTAFLDSPTVKLADDLNAIIADDNFIIFVPNSLTWHPAYQNRNENEIEKFYIEILNVLLNKGLKVIMLPQLYNVNNRSDELYFKKLKQSIVSDNIYVLNESYGSDIQQSIIHRAKCVIGARYHSIVFAINNETKFVALSYEHKMTGLLANLSLNQFEFDITKLGSKEFNIDNGVKEVVRIYELNHDLALSRASKIRASDMAKDTYTRLCEYIM